MVPWKIMELNVLPNYRLQLKFADGLEGVLDLAEFVCADLSGTVFESLHEVSFFTQAYLSPFGAVTWPGEIDMAPDAMYQDIAAGNGYFRVPAPQKKVA